MTCSVCHAPRRANQGATYIVGRNGALELTVLLCSDMCRRAWKTGFARSRIEAVESGRMVRDYYVSERDSEESTISNVGIVAHKERKRTVPEITEELLAALRDVWKRASEDWADYDGPYAEEDYGDEYDEAKCRIERRLDLVEEFIGALQAKRIAEGCGLIYTPPEGVGTDA